MKKVIALYVFIKNYIVMKKLKKEEYFDLSLKKLEEDSLNAMWKHCPLCGVVGQNYYCKSCDFKWEPGRIYFYNDL